PSLPGFCRALLYCQPTGIFGSDIAGRLDQFHFLLSLLYAFCITQVPIKELSSPECSLAGHLAAVSKRSGNAKTQAWKKQSGSIGDGFWLHGNELFLWPSQRQERDDRSSSCRF